MGQPSSCPCDTIDLQILPPEDSAPELGHSYTWVPVSEDSGALGETRRAKPWRSWVPKLGMTPSARLFDWLVDMLLCNHIGWTNAGITFKR